MSQGQVNVINLMRYSYSITVFKNHNNGRRKSASKVQKTEESYRDLNCINIIHNSA